jgi:hypothetical protein
MKKTESVAEFLARGGKITVVPANQTPIKIYSIKSTTNGGPVTIMSMGEADLYYGEFKARKAKKSTSTIDLSALPEALRKKYVDEVISASKDEEEDEED